MCFPTKIAGQERNLHFNPDGTVEGSGSFESTVNGFVHRPRIEWTESYAWGNILVTKSNELGRFCCLGLLFLMVVLKKDRLPFVF